MAILRDLRKKGCTNRVQQWIIDSGYTELELIAMFRLTKITFKTMLEDPRKYMTIFRMETLSIIANVTPKDVFEELLIRGKKIKDVQSKEELSLLIRLEKENGIRNNKALVCRACKRAY
jgi:hypothetical protein